MIKVNAIFQGQNGSLGFVHGKQYKLLVSQDKTTEKVYIKNINDIDQNCEYSNAITFLENWKNVTSINE